MQKLSEQNSKNKTVLGAFSFPHSHCQPHISLRVKIEFISKHTPSSPEIKITSVSPKLPYLNEEHLLCHSLKPNPPENS